ncbi:MAG: CHASE2 domain-containing protein [Hyphomicrobiaceae bacterium]|nr:CHASE2 domain-containing protein [Hyphomicrobiaceae bacterium]
MEGTLHAELARTLRGARAYVLVVLALLYAAVAGLLGVALYRADIDIVDTFDKHVGDWRIALGSPRAAAQRPDIAVVLITEETLLDYESRSPIDRGLVAELIRAVDAAEPKAIGVDLIFDRRTRQDTRLIEVLRQAKAPVVLGSVDARVANIPAESLTIQDQFLKAAGRPYGHVMLGRKESLLEAYDSVIRYVAQTDRPRPAVAGASRAASGGVATAPPPAFADAVAAAIGIAPRPGSRLISWLRPPDTQTELFATLALPRHSPETLKPALEGLFQPSWRDLLKDRVVLIGATMIDRDQHATPLSVLDHERMPGVLIQAQALAQRMDGNRDIRELNDWLVALFSGGVALACLLVARRTGLNPHGVFYGLLGVGLIGTTSFLVYWLWRIDVPSIALATAWVLGGFGGFLSNSLVPRRG